MKATLRDKLKRIGSASLALAFAVQFVLLGSLCATETALRVSLPESNGVFSGKVTNTEGQVFLLPAFLCHTDIDGDSKDGEPSSASDHDCSDCVLCDAPTAAQADWEFQLNSSSFASVALELHPTSHTASYADSPARAPPVV